MPLTDAELQTLDQVLQQVLDLPLTDRAAWIDALPPPHDSLAPLLRVHLLSDKDAEGMETNDWLGTLPPLPAYQASGDDPAMGERVGPYRLVRLLGEGGMSSVWLAERTEGSLRREVALKLPHRDMLDRGLAARMERERDILAGLNDDHIARLYDAGVDAAGRPYLALEYVVGVPINQYCAEAKLDLDARIRLMVQVARAVAHAHANLVVHRDLKPSNILVTTGDAAPRVKLLDFGIAKLLASKDQPQDAPDLTQMLGRALTPDYASPEQLLEKPVTTSSDIYSLGVVLYEVVTGEKPYKLKRQSAQALAEAVIHADVMRPSKRSGEGVYANEARRIEGDLDAIILKALKAAPIERYATASALADDLERFLARQPVLARPDSVGYRTRRFLQRHALAVSAAAVVSVALIAGAAIALWQAQQARLETAKTKAVKDFLLSIISVGSVDQQDALARRKQPIGDVLLDAAKSMPGRFADQPEVRSELQGLLGTALGDLSMHESARTLQETRLAELKARSAPLAETMRAQVDLATTLADSADAARSDKLLQESIDALGGATDVTSRKVLAHALRASSMNKVVRYDGTSGVEDAARAVGIAVAVEPGSKNHVSALSLLGFAYAHAFDLPNAEIAFNRAIELAHALPPSDRAYEATVRERYADSLRVRRYHERSLAQLNEAMKIVESSSGRETFRWAFIAQLSASLTAATGNAPRAFELYEGALQVFGKFGKELDPQYISNARALYSSALAEYGRLADADRISRLGFAPYQHAKSGTPDSIWLPATRRAYVLQMVGDYAQSEKILNDVLAAMHAAKVDRSRSDVPAGENLLALSLMYRGEHARAETMLKDVIAMIYVQPGRFVNHIHASRLALARCYLEQGKLDEAETEIGVLRKVIANVADDEIAISRPAAAQLENLIGHLQLKRGDPQDAAVHFQRSIDFLLPRVSPVAPLLANARADLALAMALSGDRAQAKALAQQAREAFAQHPAVGPHLRQSLIAADKLLGRS